MTAERPTPERLAMAGDDVEDFVTETGRRTVRLLDGSILDKLSSRGAITGDQYAAGAQFYQDWYFSGLASSGVIDPARVVVDGGGQTGQTDKALAAMTEWKDAVQAVGSIHSNALVSVVLLEEPIWAYGCRRFNLRDRKDGALAGRVSLINALTALDHHYHKPRTTPTRASHTADYRPAIPPPEEGS